MGQTVPSSSNDFPMRETFRPQGRKRDRVRWARDKTVKRAQALPAPFGQAILGDDKAPGRRAILALIEALEVETELFSALRKTPCFRVVWAYLSF